MIGDLNKQKATTSIRDATCPTPAVTTTRSTFEIEDPSLGPGRVDFRSPDEGFGLERTPKPKIQRDPSSQKEIIMCVGRRCNLNSKTSPVLGDLTGQHDIPVIKQATHVT